MELDKEAIHFQVGRNSGLYQEFREQVLRELETENPSFLEAKSEWERFFRNSHGEIFNRLKIQSPESELFIDSLYFDFVIDGIIKFIEEKFDFKLRNLEPQDNTKAISFSFEDLHSSIISLEKLQSKLQAKFDKKDFLEINTDFLRNLYEHIIRRKIRLELGEYYTPKGVAELAFDSVNDKSIKDESFLDTGCGSGIFLSVCIDKKIQKLNDENPQKTLDNILSNVYGIDLNPIAVKNSKLNYLLSLLPLIKKTHVNEIEIPVFLTDSLKLTRNDKIIYRKEELDIEVDNLLGNPPWITWDRLSDYVKNRWREKYVEKLDLIPHNGVELRLGHSNDDISVPFIWVSIYHYLKEGGNASFVLKRNIMKNTAGKLLRTMKVNGREFSIEHIHDFNDLRVFGDQVGANTAIYTFHLDNEPEFPIVGTSWGKISNFSSLNSIKKGKSEKVEFVPVDKSEKFSPLIRKGAELAALGECNHEIRHGIKDDAKDVFKIEREKLNQVDNELVYPYIKSRHVIKYGLLGHELHLIPIKKANEDNLDELKNYYHKTYAYLDKYRNILENRSSKWLDGGTFYNVFGLGEYTWSDYKVAWCRLGWKPHFTVISTVQDKDLGEKKVIPGDHYMFIPTDSKKKAYFLTALLNSSIYQATLKNIASEGKSSLSKKVISRLALPQWVETEETNRLVELSIKAEECVSEYNGMSRREYNKQEHSELKKIQSNIDELVEQLLTEEELFDMSGQRSLSTF